MHKMTETQIQDGRVMVALDAEELRPLLDYWIDMEVGSEFYRYVGYAMPEPRRMSHVRTRRAALLAVMEPKDVALVQRDAYVRCWCKAVEWYSSKPKPLDHGTVKRTHTENRMAPDDPLDAGIYSDPRGYIACLGLPPLSRGSRVARSCTCVFAGT